MIRQRQQAFMRHPLYTGGLLIVLLVTVAFHYSLISLARELTVQTPLAYLGLVPAVALLLGWFRAAKGRLEPATPPLRLDFLLGRLFGVVLVLAAFILVLLVPTSIEHWLNRLDLIALPLFAGGLIAIFYGVRRLWTFRFPVLFLLLAWPVPYLPLVGDGLRWLTEATISAVIALNAVIPFARPVEIEGTFEVSHAGSPFLLTVGAACAGANSLVGFGLIGTATAYVLDGRMRRKIAWLAAGMVLAWLLNIVRIEGIFAAGVVAGEDAALDVLHPIAGLIIFNAGVFAMLLLAPRFGLTYPVLGASTARDTEAGRARVGPPLFGIAAILAVGVAVVNGGYAQFEPLANGLAQPRLHSFNLATAQLSGWGSGFVARYEHGKPYFGENSIWDRVQYVSEGDAALSTNHPVYVDVIKTDDVNALLGYGVEDCYRFHGYLIEGSSAVSLSPGVDARLVNYHDPKTQRDWSALWWEWPYWNAAGVHYERIVILMPDGPRASYKGVVVVGAGDDNRFDETEQFLVAFGSQLVAGQLANQRES